QLLALARLGERCLPACDKALPVGRCDKQPHVGPDDEELDDVPLGIQINEQPDWLPETSRAWQLVARQSVDPAVGRDERQAIGRLRMKMNEGAIAFAPLEVGDLFERQMPL